jgi:pilus assembly protein Flp/PilA
MRNSTMQSVRKFAARFSRDEDGVTMLEYTILLGIITIAVISSVAFAGTWVAGKWTALTAKLT